MMRFRPCIDLHDGKVKQIVGSSLRDTGEVTENFVASMPPEYFADMYFMDGLQGGHVIMLGKGNEDAARAALGAHPGNLQVGGGINPANGVGWLEAGASHVIVTSFLFENGEFDMKRLKEISNAVGRDRLVIDLSCLPIDGVYHVACNRWQTVCKMILSNSVFDELTEYCAEYLVHAVQVEGKQGGIDERLVSSLAEWCRVPVTYAGGIASHNDIENIRKSGGGRVDFTVGSALDIFGGKLLKYADMIAL